MADTSASPIERDEHEEGRRNFLFLATGAVGAVTAGALVWPFIHQMNPDASVQAAGTVSVDLSPVEPGQEISVMWRGKPVFVRHLTAAEIEEARATPLGDLKDPQSFEDRVPEGYEQWLIQIGVCTHLGCIPITREGEYKGWFCPCHGSHYDTAGRIRRGPAVANLEIPEQINFVSDTEVILG